MAKSIDVRSRTTTRVRRRRKSKRRSRKRSMASSSRPTSRRRRRSSSTSRGRSYPGHTGIDAKHTPGELRRHPTLQKRIHTRRGAVGGRSMTWSSFFRQSITDSCKSTRSRIRSSSRDGSMNASSMTHGCASGSGALHRQLLRHPFVRVGRRTGYTRHPLHDHDHRTVQSDGQDENIK